MHVWLEQVERASAHLAVMHAVHLPASHSAEHCDETQLPSGKKASTAPSHPEATQRCQHGPTCTPDHVSFGASLAGQAWMQLATSRHPFGPLPTIDGARQVSNVESPGTGY